MRTNLPAAGHPADLTTTASNVFSRYHDAHRDFLELVASGIHPEMFTELVAFTRTFIEALNAASFTHPAELAEMARDNVAWPVMAARHLPEGADFTALADRIQLGTNVVVSVSPRATYRYDTPFNRWLLGVLLHDYLDTPKQFYFLKRPEHQPRLTRRTLSWFLDERIMSLLDRLREDQGDWDGIPSLAALVKCASGPAQQRRIARQHIKAALLEMAGPEEESA